MNLLSDQIRAACNSLSQNRNHDGGLDATRHGDNSGCWTTASALWSMSVSSGVTLSGLAAVRDMARFLLETQIVEGEDAGGWPMMPGAPASTMASGHAVAAFLASRGLFDTDPEFHQRVDGAIDRGLRWLERWQAPDGGWGPQPVSGGGATASRIFSTHYALMCFWTEGGSTARYQAMKAKSIKYLISCRNRDGSWGAGAAVERISDTARAMTSLIQCKAYAPDHKVILQAAKFLVKNQGKKGLWPLGRVELLFPRSNATSVFSNNSSLDALVALSLLKTLDHRTRDAVTHGLRWLLESQEDGTGRWYLSSPYDTKDRSEVHSWPTAEWISAVTAVTNAVACAAPVKAREWWHGRAIRLTAPFVVLSLLALGWFGGVHWSSLSEATRSFVLVSIVLALAINIMSTFMWGYISEWWGRVSRDADRT